MSKYDRLWDYIQKQQTDFAELTFDEMSDIAGTTVDHSFLTYKKELVKYGWSVDKISMKERKVKFRRSDK